MSLMRIGCPWCGTEYHFGVVDSSMIGGHNCDAVKHCETAQCSTAARWLVEDLSGETAFACTKHIGKERIVLQTQN